MNDTIPMPPWLRNALIGGTLSFGYSYRPLHGALTWRVNDLEERIDARNFKNMKLEADAPAALLNSSPVPSKASPPSPAGEEQGIIPVEPTADTSGAQL